MQGKNVIDCATAAPILTRGETIHRKYGASRFNGHDSVHDSFSPSFDTVGSLKCKQKLSINCQLDR